MKKARIALNNAIKENYAFFCPQSNLHLGLMDPVGFTDRVTPSIVRGLKGKTLLDLDNMIDVKGECFIEAEKVDRDEAEKVDRDEAEDTRDEAEDTRDEAEDTRDEKVDEVEAENTKVKAKEEKPASKKKAASKATKEE